MELNKRDIKSMIDTANSGIVISNTDDIEEVVQERKKIRLDLKNITIDKIFDSIKGLISGLTKSNSKQNEGEEINNQNKTNESKNNNMNMEYGNLEDIKIEIMCDLIATEDKSYYGEVLASNYVEDDDSIEAMKELASMHASEMENIARKAVVRLKGEGIIGNNEMIPSGEINAICSDAQNAIIETLKDYDLAQSDDYNEDDYVTDDEYDDEPQAQGQFEYEEEMK